MQSTLICTALIYYNGLELVIIIGYRYIPIIGYAYYIIKQYYQTIWMYSQFPKQYPLICSFGNHICWVSWWIQLFQIQISTATYRGTGWSPVVAWGRVPPCVRCVKLMSEHSWWYLSFNQPVPFPTYQQTWCHGPTKIRNPNSLLTFCIQIDLSISIDL